MISVISLICLPFTDHSILFLVILRGSFFFGVPAVIEEGQSLADVQIKYWTRRSCYNVC